MNYLIEGCKHKNFKKIGLFLLIYCSLSITFTLPFVFSTQENITQNTLSPRISANVPNWQIYFSQVLSLNANRQDLIFNFQNNWGNKGLEEKLNFLNSKYLASNKKEAAFQKMVDFITADAELMHTISALIRNQDRMNVSADFSVDRVWAERFKNEVLKRAVINLSERHFFFLQMEYEFSMQFLKNYQNHLLSYGLTEKEAEYATGQFAKLQMAGGLGSFKPDLVQGFYDDLKEFLGPIKARDHIHVLGVMYAKDIKGEGSLVKDSKLDLIEEKIKQERERREKFEIRRKLENIISQFSKNKKFLEANKMLDLYIINIGKNIKDSSKLTNAKLIANLQKMVKRYKDAKIINPEVGKIVAELSEILNKFDQDDPSVHELVGVARNSLDLVTTYKNIEVNMHGVGKVDVEVYRNPFSKLHEYWMYCPQVFHEAYAGGTDDAYRAVQTFVYREVWLRHMKNLYDRKLIGKRVVFSTSETSTTIQNPLLMDQDLSRYKDQEDKYKEWFKFLSELDILYHHYNHTVVPAGLNSSPMQLFSGLKLSNKFYGLVMNKEKIDLRLLTGVIHDLLTGCSSAHTQICKEQAGLYKFVAYKFMEDALFGNSEGSDIERWQADEFKQIIRKYMKILGISKEKLTGQKVSLYPEFFMELNKNENLVLKNSFKNEMSSVKKEVKQRFIDKLFEGSFGPTDVAQDELAQIEKEYGLKPLIDRPIFTFVRRMVEYKCSNIIVDMLEDKNYRNRIFKAGAAIFIGGRKFSDFSQEQHERIKRLMQEYPRLKAHIFFVSNHNINTSYLIQQGTNNGGMLSQEGMEAGPTSPSNAGLNWSVIFSSPDGVMIERAIEAERDAAGKIIKGTGYVIKYKGKGQNRLPDKDSIIQEMEKSANDYEHKEDYNEIAFNNLMFQMTQGDIRTQAAGLIKLMSEQIDKKKQNQIRIEQAVENFVDRISEDSMENILTRGRGDVGKVFEFNSGTIRKAKNKGVTGFLTVLKYNTQQGYIYNTNDFLTYMQGLLKDLPGRKGVLEILTEINSAAMIDFEKQREFIKVLETLSDFLQQGKSQAIFKRNGFSLKEKQAIMSFSWSCKLDEIKNILYQGQNGVRPFVFSGATHIKEAKDAGLAAFVDALTLNCDQGYTYLNLSDFRDYLAGLIGKRPEALAITDILQEIIDEDLPLAEQQQKIMFFLQLLEEELKTVTQAFSRENNNFPLSEMNFIAIGMSI